MDLELAREWCTALRSGDYQQGFGQLRTTDNRYCCLGVLGDLLVKKGKAKWDEEYLFIDDGCFTSFLPNKVFDTNFNQSEYSHMNDTSGSFYDIANKLEEQFGLNEDNNSICYTIQPATA